MIFQYFESLQQMGFCLYTLVSRREESFECKRSVVDLRRQLLELRRWAGDSPTTGIHLK